MINHCERKRSSRILTQAHSPTHTFVSPMPERHPKRRRAPAISLSRRSHPPKASFRRSKPPKATRLIRRTSSEPILWTFRLIPDDGGRGIGEAVFLPRPHTCADIFAPVCLGSPSPSPSPRLSMEGEAVKVVVNVTVEGSPGPVRAMVRLGASVEEAIGVVLDRYGREGRSPKLESPATASFQLHHSHFSLHSLDKSEKIGDVGSRSFYLRKSPNNKCFSSTESNTGAARGSEIELLTTDPTHFFLSFIAKRLDKIGRRTRRLWKVFVCMTCG